MRSLYSALLYLSMPVVLLLLAIRGLRDPDYLKRWSERFGRFHPPDNGGGILIHAVSVGEVNAASVLQRGLSARFPDIPLAMTTFTPTGSERVRDLFGSEVFHVYWPFDLPGSVRRFLDRTRPRILVIMETEIWPNLYREAEARGIPIVIANARISDRSLGAYRRVRRLTASALRGVAAVAAQSEGDAERLIELGAPPGRVTVTGNIKFDMHLPASLNEQGESIRTAWGTHRPIVVGGSTHEADEVAMLAAFTRLLADWPNALLVLAPRHPERFARAAQLARAAGLGVSLRSEGLSCPASANCYVVDAMGELLAFYAAADVAFVGGSIEAIGGHNMLEPAALARPVLFGPHTANFKDISQQLVDNGAGLRVKDAADLESVLRRLLSEPESRDRMGQAALKLVRAGQGAADRTLDLLGPLITEDPDR